MHPRLPPTPADPSTALLSALAARGVSAQAMIVAMRPTGSRRESRAPDEYEFQLTFTTAAGVSIRATVRQFMLPEALDGLRAGAPATIMYDRTNPTALVVRRSPNVAAPPLPATAEAFAASTADEPDQAPGAG